jgi:hypothetical protein
MNGEKSGESGRMVQPLLIEWLQSSRWDQAIFLMIPGTSCLATIVLSLRDKNHPPIEAPRIILAITGYRDLFGRLTFGVTSQGETPGKTRFGRSLTLPDPRVNPTIKG